MAIYAELHDGTRLEFPDETAPDVIQRTVKKHLSKLDWEDVPKQALINSPKSMAQVLSGMGQVIAHPIDTGKNLLDIAAGGLQNALPESVNQAIASIDPGAENAALAREKADQVGEFYKQRYGSEEGIKQAIATDPVGVALDASTLLSGGGSLLARAPGMARTGAALKTAASYTDPLLNTARVSKYGLEKLGAGAANVIGGVGTHTGAESLKSAARAGLEGGAKQAAFVDNMRGNVTAEEMLPELKSALYKMRQDRGSQYRQGMGGIAQDQTIIPMTGVKTAIDDALNIKRFKGESISPTTQAIQNELLGQYDRWANLDPAQFHTAEGLDAFKQSIGDIRDNTAPHTPQRTAASRVYDAVKQEIVKQAPEYATVMKDYEQASKLTNEIEKALSLGEKASADTAIRKLQSLTRNNVNTNYGNRLKLAKELEANGADNLTEKLSGQALSTWTPRGLGGLSAMGTGSYGLYAHDPLAIPLLAVQSPRLMGEAALLTGKAARIGGKSAELVKDAALNLGINPEDLTKIVYQARDRKKASSN